MDPATGQEVEELYANDLYDVIGLGYSKAKKKLTGAYCEGPKDVIRHFFDPQTEESFRKLQTQLPGYQVGTNRDEQGRGYEDRLQRATTARAARITSTT